MKLLAALAFIALVGCGGSKFSYDPASAGLIQGKVTFTGAAPAMPVLDMSANPACERLNKVPVRAEQVVVNANGTLRNTFVWLKSGVSASPWPAPSESAKLDQAGCVYQPHVLGLMVGQTLEISNSDTVNHNIHAEAATNASWNITEPPRAEKKTQRFEREEVMFPVTCGVHPWMRGYIGVVSHPFFAVTGDDGTFALKGVPPGTYTVEAVHEKYGKREMQVTIAARETKGLDFRYTGEASN